MKLAPGLGLVCACGSHPARGAWIETGKIQEALLKNGVAPRTGCVD